jgi:hypothetical protein
MLIYFEIILLIAYIAFAHKSWKSSENGNIKLKPSLVFAIIGFLVCLISTFSAETCAAYMCALEYAAVGGLSSMAVTAVAVILAAKGH